MSNNPHPASGNGDVIERMLKRLREDAAFETANKAECELLIAGLLKLSEGSVPERHGNEEVSDAELLLAVALIIEAHHIQQFGTDRVAALRRVADFVSRPEGSCDGKVREFGAEPRGCPTPGACSCPTPSPAGCVSVPRELLERAYKCASFHTPLGQEPDRNTLAVDLHTALSAVGEKRKLTGEEDALLNRALIDSSRHDYDLTGSAAEMRERCAKIAHLHDVNNGIECDYDRGYKHAAREIEKEIRALPTPARETEFPSIPAPVPEDGLITGSAAEMRERCAKAAEAFDAAANQKHMKPFADAFLIGEVYKRDAAIADAIRALPLPQEKRDTVAPSAPSPIDAEGMRAKIEEIIRHEMRDADGDVLYNGCVSVGYVQPENAAQKIIEDIATQILALPTPAREIDREKLETACWFAGLIESAGEPVLSLNEWKLLAETLRHLIGGRHAS